MIFQVRPAADALYPSPHEPWSEYLTGASGHAYNPHYADQVESWLSGAQYPWAFTRAATP